jgi:hypothetical protein
MSDDRLYDRRTVLGMTATGALGGIAGCTGNGDGGGGGDTPTPTSTPTAADPAADESTPTSTEGGSEDLSGCRGFEAEMVPYEPPEDGLVTSFEYPDFPNARTLYEEETSAGVGRVEVRIVNREIGVLLNQNTGGTYTKPSDTELLTEITFDGETVEVEGKFKQGTPTLYRWFLVVPFDGNEYAFANETRYFPGDAGEECRERLRSTSADVVKTFSVRQNADPPS